MIYQNHLHFELTDTINQGTGHTIVAPFHLYVTRTDRIQMRISKHVAIGPVLGGSLAHIYPFTTVS